MRSVVNTWFKGVLVGGAASALSMGNVAQAQDFKIPPNVSHFVYRPGEDIAVLEELREWTFGLGLVIGFRDAATMGRTRGYGLVAHATFGGPYWYWSGGAGVWNAGSPSERNIGLGLNFNYNVLQSPDLRTRVGPQFGWSTSSAGAGRTYTFTYRAQVSHAFDESFSLFGGLGAETSRAVGAGRTVSSTRPSLMAGIYKRLGDRLGWSTGIEAVLTDPSTFTFASSFQFEPNQADNPGQGSAGRGSSRRPPSIRH